MGLAELDTELCAALKGNRCEVCYRACPLIDEAITIIPSLRQGDSTHVIFEPTINSEACVGCGICEERCVVSDPKVAIRIRPREIVDSY
jgi:ferredoxin-type protein NapG